MNQKQSRIWRRLESRARSVEKKFPMMWNYVHLAEQECERRNQSQHNPKRNKKNREKRLLWFILQSPLLESLSFSLIEHG